MTFIKPEQLGIYAPKTNEKAQKSQEAQKIITEAIFTYKQLFYGLRTIAWQKRDKAATFYEALTNGELDQFKMAPGHRTEDGGYSKSEWDYDRLNAYMWNRFRERFDAAFNLEDIAELKTLRDIKKATDELLEIALTNWGDDLLGAKRLKETDRVESIGKGVTSCKIDYENLKITGQFRDTERTITLSAQGVPEVIIHQTKGETSWKGGIHIDTFGNPIVLTSQKAETFSKMLELASRLNVGINEFMANPEGFLGLETDQAHKRNLQLIKEALLKINHDAYEKRKAETTQPQTRSINEVIDAAGEDEVDVTEEDIDIQEVEVQTSPVSKPKIEVRAYKSNRTKQQEANDWLKNNPEFAEDLDAELGISEIDIPDTSNSESDEELV